LYLFVTWGIVVAALAGVVYLGLRSERVRSQVALPVRRLGPLHEEQWCIEIEDDNLLASDLLLHLEGLEALRVLSKFSYPISDDVWAEFEYQGHVFDVDSPMARLCVSARRGCPETVFMKVENHIRAFTRPPILRSIRALVRYLFLPPWPRAGATASKREGARSGRGG